MFAFDRRYVSPSTGLTAIGSAVWPPSVRPLRSDGTDESTDRTLAAQPDDDDSATAHRVDDADRATRTDDDLEIDTGTDAGADDTESVDESQGPSVEFRDCETVRITGSADEVLLSLFWWDESGLIGTIAEPVGGVDGERPISATEEFGSFAYGPVVTEVELFDVGTPVVPGGGDVVVSNPDAEPCTVSIREEYDGPGELESVEFERA